MRTLVVDDEILVREFVAVVLAREGYNIIEAGDGFEALELASQHQFDLIITDYKMPGMNGCELITRLIGHNCPARYLLISGTGPKEAVDVAFLRKPFTAEQLLDAVERIEIPVPLVDLQVRMKKARAKWLKTTGELDDIVREVPSGIPQPDSSLRIQKAGDKQTAAYKKYKAAFEKYRAALVRSRTEI